MTNPLGRYIEIFPPDYSVARVVSRGGWKKEADKSRIPSRRQKQNAQKQTKKINMKDLFSRQDLIMFVINSDEKWKKKKNLNLWLWLAIVTWILNIELTFYGNSFEYFGY